MLSVEMPGTTVSWAARGAAQAMKRSAASHRTGSARQGEELVRPDHQVAEELEADPDYEQREQHPELLRPEAGREDDPDLGADDAADEQDQREEDVDRAALDGVQHGGDPCDEQELEDRGAD